MSPTSWCRLLIVGWTAALPLAMAPSRADGNWSRLLRALLRKSPRADRRSPGFDRAVETLVLRLSKQSDLNQFKTFRGFEASSKKLGPDFLADWNRWGEGTRVLHVGAGSGGLECDLIDRFAEAGRAAPELILLGIRKPTIAHANAYWSELPLCRQKAIGAVRRLDEYLRRYPETLAYVEGRLGRRVDGRKARALEQTLGGIGSFDAIISVVGADSYEWDQTGLHLSIGRLLKPGGRFYTSRSWPKVLAADMIHGFDLIDWYDAMTGFRLVSHDRGVPLRRATLERVDEPLYVPEWRFLPERTEDGSPPRLHWVWAGR